MNEVKEYLTLKEVAELLTVSESTVYRWTAEGKLPGTKIGDVWRYRKEDIDKLFENGKK